MKVGILGSGDVGKTLARGFAAKGHDVKIGSRDPAKLKDFAKGVKGKVSPGTFAETAVHGEVVVLATLGAAVEEAVGLAGVTNFDGKVVLDATNPLDFSKGMPPSNFLSPPDSLGARVQKKLPKAKVVKVFNTVPNALMFEPKVPGGAPEMLICGNDAGAKKQTELVLREFGWPGAIDIGGIQEAAWLEAIVPLWVRVCVAVGNWNVTWKVVKG